MRPFINLCIFSLLLSRWAVAQVTAEFSFENAAGAIVRTEESQGISVNGKSVQENKFKTTFEITDITKEGDAYHVQVTYRKQQAELVINGQALDTMTDPQLKEASDDLIGRKLTYVVGPDFKVKEVEGLLDLQNSKAGRTFGTGVDEIVFKRTFERLLLTRENVSAPLTKGDDWQISEETVLDPQTKFLLKSDVVLVGIDEHQLIFDISSKAEIAATDNQDVSIDTPKGSGKIVWNRDTNLPMSIMVDTAVKITKKQDAQNTSTLEIASSSKTVLEPKNISASKEASVAP